MFIFLLYKNEIDFLHKLKLRHIFLIFNNDNFEIDNLFHFIIINQSSFESKTLTKKSSQDCQRISRLCLSYLLASNRAITIHRNIEKQARKLSLILKILNSVNRNKIYVEKI